MKTTFLILALFLACSAIGQQKVTEISAGIYTAVKTEKKTSQATGKVFVDSKGVQHPVLMSSKGNLYYVRTSKSGSKYNVYLKTN